MKESRFSGSQVAGQIPGDVGINGIRWQGDRSNNILFDLSVGYWRGELTCTWVSDLKVALDYGEYGGVIPAFDCEIARIENGGWSVIFDLSPVGSVILNCHDLQLDVHNP